MNFILIITITLTAVYHRASYFATLLLLEVIFLLLIVALRLIMALIGQLISFLLIGLYSFTIPSFFFVTRLSFFIFITFSSGQTLIMFVKAKLTMDPCLFFASMILIFSATIFSLFPVLSLSVFIFRPIIFCVVIIQAVFYYAIIMSFCVILIAFSFIITSFFVFSSIINVFFYLPIIAFFYFATIAFFYFPIIAFAYFPIIDFAYFHTIASFAFIIFVFLAKPPFSFALITISQFRMHFLPTKVFVVNLVSIASSFVVILPSFLPSILSILILFTYFSKAFPFSPAKAYFSFIIFSFAAISQLTIQFQAVLLSTFFLGYAFLVAKKAQQKKPLFVLGIAIKLTFPSRALFGQLADQCYFCNRFMDWQQPVLSILCIAAVIICLLLLACSFHFQKSLLYALSSFQALATICLPHLALNDPHYFSAHLLQDGSKTVAASLGWTRRHISFRLQSTFCLFMRQFGDQLLYLDSVNFQQCLGCFLMILKLSFIQCLGLQFGCFVVSLVILL